MDKFKNGYLGMVLTGLIAGATIFGWYTMSKNYEVFTTKTESSKMEDRFNGRITEIRNDLLEMKRDLREIVRAVR